MERCTVKPHLLDQTRVRNPRLERRCRSPVLVPPCAQLLKRFAVSLDQLTPLDDRPRRAPRLARGLEDLSESLWCPSIGDGAAGNLGSGASQAGTLAINLGSSAAVREMRSGRAARAPRGLFAYRVDTQRYLVGGAISNAGNLREWCLRELRVPDDHRRLERLLSRRSRPDHGLHPVLRSQRLLARAFYRG